MKIFILSTTGGVVSSYLHHSIKPGDLLDVGVPSGDFVLQPGSSCVFLGAGIGITPLLSMMKVILTISPNIFSSYQKSFLLSCTECLFIIHSIQFSL